MKLKKEYLVRAAQGEGLLVPTGAAPFTGLVRGNAVFGRVLELLRSEVSETGLVSALGAEYDAPESVIAADVKKALMALRSIGAIDE